MAVPKDLWLAYLRIFLIEAAYWIVSIGMVFVNKFVLTDELTIFITLFQMTFALCTLVTLSYYTRKCVTPYITNQSNYDEPSKVYTRVSIDDERGPDEQRQVSSASSDSCKTQIIGPTSDTTQPDGMLSLFYINIPERIDFSMCKIVFPLSVLYIGMLLLNNFCLRSVGVAFYFVSRSLTTVFNVLFTYIIIHEKVSKGALICCAFIIFGYVLGVDQESIIGSLSVIGVIYGIASSLFTSLFTIYTKKILDKLNKNIWALILYNNINAITMCTPLMFIHGDVHSLMTDTIVNPNFWFLLSISGAMAFFISIVTNASIKYTSPLTHTISGTAKACFQTVLAVLYYHEHKSALWWFSNLTILVASAAYSRIKQLEMERKSRLASEHATAMAGSNAFVKCTTTTTSTTTKQEAAQSNLRRPSSSSTDSETMFDVRNMSSECLVTHGDTQETQRR